MKTRWETGRPPISETTLEECIEAAPKIARRLGKSNGRWNTARYLNVYLHLWPFSEDQSGAKKHPKLPLWFYDLSKQKAVSRSLQTLDKDDRVMITYDSENDFRRRGYYNHSLQHNLMYRIHCGSFGFLAARRYD